MPHAAERQQQVRLHHDRRRQQREQQQREGDADAEEDRQRLVAAVAGLHQPLLQLAHLLARLRRHRAEPLERADHGLEARLLLDVAGEGQLLDPALDGRGAAGISAMAPAATSSGAEQKRQYRKQHRHGYTSILTTCRIQKYPTICITTAAASSMWPIGSRKSSCMCSGLMNASAMARNAGSASST